MSKRTQFASSLQALGVTRLLASVRRSPGVLVINHHRIGCAESERFDRGLFSATAEQFDQQLSYLQRHYHVVSLPELQDFIAHPKKLRNFHVMLTFDDGYRDNHDIAFPLLRARSIPATFFLPTFLVGSAYLPWWDVIAYLVRSSQRTTLQLSYPVAAEISLPQVGNRERAIQQVLRIYKGQKEVSEAKFLSGLSNAAEVAMPAQNERRFLNWQEARAMLAGGMAIGSHTHSHTILSQLSFEQQRDELARSKHELEAELATKIDALAYPVGSRAAFNEQTVRALRETGYTIAFSHYYGVNSPAKLNAFDVMRTKPPLDQPLFRLKTSLAAAFHYDWV